MGTPQIPPWAPSHAFFNLHKRAMAPLDSAVLCSDWDELLLKYGLSSGTIQWAWFDDDGYIRYRRHCTGIDIVRRVYFRDTERPMEFLVTRASDPMPVVFTSRGGKENYVDFFDYGITIVPTSTHCYANFITILSPYNGTLRFLGGIYAFEPDLRWQMLRRDFGKAYDRFGVFQGSSFARARNTGNLDAQSIFAELEARELPVEIVYRSQHPWGQLAVDAFAEYVAKMPSAWKEQNKTRVCQFLRLLPRECRRQASLCPDILSTDCSLYCCLVCPQQRTETRTYLRNRFELPGDVFDMIMTPFMTHYAHASTDPYARLDATASGIDTRKYGRN